MEEKGLGFADLTWGDWTLSRERSLPAVLPARWFWSAMIALGKILLQGPAQLTLHSFQSLGSFVRDG